ncbi:MAG: hypothetical protein V3T28_09560 [Gemmatimonadales bacterium]
MTRIILEPPARKLARLTIPRRVYTKSQIDYVVDTCRELFGPALLLLLGACGALPALDAQEPPVLKAGARIRVWVPERNEPVIGSLFNVGADSLWVFVDSVQPRAMALRDISYFELSRGKHPALLLGSVFVGGVSGAIVGPAVLTEDDRCRLNVVDDPACRHETSDLLIGVAVGAIALGWLGGWIASERWVEVPLGWLIAGVRPVRNSSGALKGR